MAKNTSEQPKKRKSNLVIIVVFIVVLLGIVGMASGGNSNSKNSDQQSAATEQQAEETQKWDANAALSGRTIENAWDVAEAEGWTPTFYMYTNEKDAFPAENRHSSTAQTWRVGFVKDVDQKAKTVTCIVYNNDQFVEKFGESAKVD